jgi:hypothetical protein
MVSTLILLLIPSALAATANAIYEFAVEAG